mgnify:CR=1 FL=1
MKQRAFEIIHEDPEILVINKKSGILSVPDRYHPEKPNLYTLLTQYRGLIYPLHRLDKCTSGIMLYAKNEEVHKYLSSLFEERKVIKEYFAVISGAPPEKKGKIETFLAPALHRKEMMMVSKKGKLAITEYEVTEEYQHYSLLKLIISTGRQHQIRVHMQHIGYPLSVDNRYGGKDALYAFDIKLKKFHQKDSDQSRPLIDRCTLHAHTLSFNHPHDEKWVSYQALLPKDMNALINQLRKWQAIDHKMIR